MYLRTPFALSVSLPSGRACLFVCLFWTLRKPFQATLIHIYILYFSGGIGAGADGQCSCDQDFPPHISYAVDLAFDRLRLGASGI